MRLRPSYIRILGILGICQAMAVYAAEPVPQDAYAKSDHAALSCPADAVISSVRCEGGLCISKAPGGVSGGSVVIEGKLDGGTSSGLLVSAQHDHTKAVTRINATNSLLADGTFSITVPLTQLGSYTIVIQAMRLISEPSVITVHTSRVIAPYDLRPDAVTIDDPKEKEDHVSISVDLEKTCRAQSKAGLPQDCDLIGSKTGATIVNAVNAISSGRRVARSTNAGADGKFTLCMPLGDKDNKISIEVCNPAISTPKNCITIAEKTISFSKPDIAVTWPDANPEHLRFAIQNWAPPKSTTASCDGEVEIDWNREAPFKLCPTNGEYVIPTTHHPVTGVNEMGIRLPSGQEFRSTFGWGKVVWARDFTESVQEIRIDHAVLDRHLPDMLNHFLASDNFPKLISSLLSGGSASPSAPPSAAEVAEIAKIRSEIPTCGAPSDSHVGSQVVGDVKVGSAHVDQVKLDDNRIALQLSLTHVDIPINIFGDKDGNGVPDNGFMPLRIAFKTLTLNPIIILTDSPATGLLTTDVDDCSFKSGTYCKHQPALFHPGSLTGEANKGGAIVVCDATNRLGPSDLEDKCDDVNIVNMKTGQLSETILDTLNDTLYCDVSARMTYAMRHARTKLSQDFTVLDRKFTWQMEAGLDAAGLHVGKEGVRVSIGSQMAGNGFYYVAPHVAGGVGAPLGHEMGVALREDLINQALATLVTMGKEGAGLLDWKLDEARIGVMGFDYTTECEHPSADKTPSPLCNLRPNLKTLLGLGLSNNGYYSENQPLRITIHADRKIAPHVHFRKSETGEMVVDLDIPNLQIAFAAIPENVADADEPIITANITALISLTLDKITTLASDPSQMAIHISIRPKESRVVVTPVPGSNHTLLPDNDLLSQLQSEINLGLNEFAKPDSIKPFAIPKGILLPTTETPDADGSFLSRLGLSEIRFGDDQIQWDVNAFTNALTLSADPVFIQQLLTNGTLDTIKYSQ